MPPCDERPSVSGGCCHVPHPARISLVALLSLGENCRVAMNPNPYDAPRTMEEVRAPGLRLIGFFSWRGSRVVMGGFLALATFVALCERRGIRLPGIQGDSLLLMGILYALVMAVTGFVEKRRLMANPPTRDGLHALWAGRVRRVADRKSGLMFATRSAVVFRASDLETVIPLEEIRRVEKKGTRLIFRMKSGEIIDFKAIPPGEWQAAIERLMRW